MDWVETGDGEGPFGARGVGGSGLIPTAVAIANAFYDAAGVRIWGLLLLPERVLGALGK